MIQDTHQRFEFNQFHQNHLPMKKIRPWCQMKKRNEKKNTGEGGKGKRGRTTSDDVGGKSLSDTSTSARGQCVGGSLRSSSKR
jgi:hypothetical protein